MKLIACVGLLAPALANLALTSNFAPVTPLANQNKTLKVIFFDFDKTLTVASFGDYFLNFSDPNCGTYHPTGTCNLTLTDHAYGDFWDANYNDSALFEDPAARGFNGTDRRDRLLQTLDRLAARDIQIRVLSTSWYAINASSWAYFLSRVFARGGLQSYFNLSSIITLADPGENIAADKGTAAKQYMDSIGAVFGEGLLVDDSSTNQNKSAGKVDFVRVLPTQGIALDLLEWIEQRANITDPCPVAEIQGVFTQCRVYDLSGTCSEECLNATAAFVSAASTNSSLGAGCLRDRNVYEPWLNGALDTFIQRFQAAPASICKTSAPTTVTNAAASTSVGVLALVGAVLLA